MKEQLDVFEEYDGLNSVDASGLLLVVTLPLLTRGHAIQCHVLDNEYLQVQVPNLYHCHMALPLKTDSSEVKTHFDCKIRRLFVHIPKQVVIEEAPTLDEENDLNTDIVEEDDDIEVIDTDDHFGRDNTGKVQGVDAAVKEDLDDDLLYDLC